jgi:transmembrane 9 superfamily protein 3
MWRRILAAGVLLAALFTATADEHTHKYDSGEEVVLWMNTIGPYHNRQETYTYFSLPFCKGPEVWRYSS